MAYLGEKLQSEAVRFHLTFDTAPTGTPQVAVEKQGAAILADTNMTQGVSTLEWYYDYTTGAAAVAGAYQVKYTAVIDSVTRYAYDQYDMGEEDATSVKGVVDSIQTDTTSIETKVDTAIVDIAAVPTVGEIDTELTSNHGNGAWTTGGTGTGAYSVVFNVKDGSANAIQNAYVTVHNSADDDSPLQAWDTNTDALGNTDTLNIEGAVKVRVSAGNFTYTTSSHTISASGTVNLTGVASTVSNPSDPDVCRLRLYPITLGNADITDIAADIIISSSGSLTKINGQYIKNTEAAFTYDAATVPDSYYFDAVQGASCHITCSILGIDNDITVPATATSDISDLIT